MTSVALKIKKMEALIVKDKSGCWIWQGSVSSTGYGVYGGRGAYRKYWELIRGDIPKGLEPDHLCKNRICVNLDHLEIVTHGENIRRSVDAHILAVCRSGRHKLEGPNLLVYQTRDGHQKRKCLACYQDYQTKYAKRLRERNKS